MDAAPKFDPQLGFYKDQLEKGFVFNIWKDGAWGTYRHLLLHENQSVETEHCYVNVTTRGDLSTLRWVQGSIDISRTIPEDEELVHVYYSSLNFRDLMTASGKIPPEVITTDRIHLECVQGFEFVGRNLRGERVIGMGVSGALTTLVQCKKLLLKIPDHWTMEDAATVIVVYGTVVEVLVNKANLKQGQTILIHSGTGGIGQAAINISLYYGLTVFVTVGTREKREFLQQHYPQIKEEHILNSRDTSFAEMIDKYTNGRGVDYVLNSLAEEKLFASIRCLARGGKFLEIGKFDLASNNTLELHLLEKEAEFIGMALDQHINSRETAMHSYREQMQGLLDCGAIKPLPRTVFQSDEIEKAFRYMGAGKHIGKVLIKIREEENQKLCHAPKTLFKALPRFYCKPECSYLICGGLGGFGMELADLLVIRGAKKLVLTSRSGLCGGYHKYRIRMWKHYGVTVVTSSVDASTEAGCTAILNIANEMGPVDGIFNLAVVLKDALFENLSVEDFKVPIVPKAICTKYLDSISRRLCPNLTYFVIFSSISCGRGNIGQTNYGMANSVMERICEKRKREGYPALAIQWGAIGEVGLVAKMQEDHRELVIGGTLQQRISNCLQIMDKLIAQNEPIVGSMLVAEKRYGEHADNLFEAVMNILGLTNMKSVSLHTAFPDLGMDSMMAVEIKQTLEREYEVFLTAQDIRGMTLAKLKELANNQETGPTAIRAHANIMDEIPIDAQLLLRIIGSEEFATTPVIKLKTLIQQHEDGPHVIALPGMEGMAVIFEPLSKKLKAHISCIQFCTNYKA
ncbi:dehydrogenase, partial [Oryctes borbonicus]